MDEFCASSFLCFSSFCGGDTPAPNEEKEEEDPHSIPFSFFWELRHGFATEYYDVRKSAAGFTPSIPLPRKSNVFSLLDWDEQQDSLSDVMPQKLPPFHPLKLHCGTATRGPSPPLLLFFFFFLLFFLGYVTHYFRIRTIGRERLRKKRTESQVVPHDLLYNNNNNGWWNLWPRGGCQYDVSLTNEPRFIVPYMYMRGLQLSAPTFLFFQAACTRASPSAGVTSAPLPPPTSAPARRPAPGRTGAPSSPSRASPAGSRARTSTSQRTSGQSPE